MPVLRPSWSLLPRKVDVVEVLSRFLSKTFGCILLASPAGCLCSKESQSGGAYGVKERRGPYIR